MMHNLHEVEHDSEQSHVFTNYFQKKKTQTTMMYKKYTNTNTKNHDDKSEKIL